MLHRSARPGNPSPRAARASMPGAALVLALGAAPAAAQSDARVIFWGGPATTSHDVPAFRDTIVPYLESRGMTVTYRQDPPYTWLHPDSLGRWDVMLTYTTNQNAEDLTRAQLDALTAWLDSGRVMVALHGTTNTFFNNDDAIRDDWAALTGARFQNHGPADGNGNAGRIEFSAPVHASLQGTDTLPTSAANSGGQPYWDEGRMHNTFAADTIVIARAHYTSPSVTSLPWIWIREQGEGFVYYNASGHNGETWGRPEFKGQVARALEWGHELNVTGLRGRAAVERLLAPGVPGRIVVPFASAAGHSIEVLDLQGRRVYHRKDSRAASHDVSFLPAGTYGVRILSGNREAAGRYVLRP